MAPSVTLSARIGSVTSEALASGSTFLVSTSFSCSIQARIPDSSPANGTSSSSGTLSRASRAIRATASLSSDIRRLRQYRDLAPTSRFASPEQRTRCHPSLLQPQGLFPLSQWLLASLEMTRICAPSPAPSACGHLGGSFRRHRFDFSPQLGSPCQEPREIAPVKRQKMAVADRNHVGVARLRFEQSHLAEEVALLQRNGVLCVATQLHRHLARGDEVHGVGELADGDDLLAGQRHHGAQPATDLEDGQRIERGEERHSLDHRTQLETEIERRPSLHGVAPRVELLAKAGIDLAADDRLAQPSRVFRRFEADCRPFDLSILDRVGIARILQRQSTQRLGDELLTI